MKNLLNSRFMMAVRNESTINDMQIQDAYVEFDNQLCEYLFSDAGYLNIDNVLNELLFDLRYFGRKKRGLN